MEGKDVVVLIPTLNEASGIGMTIDDILRGMPHCRVVVLDSYSENGTANLALARGATVLDAPKGGKGFAVRSMLSKVLNDYRGKWYVMLDGDYTYPARHIKELVFELQKGANAVIGYRAMKNKGSMSPINALGNWALSFLASILYGWRVRDVCSGMWGFRRGALAMYNIISDGFTLEADLFINAVRNKHRLGQIPIEYRVRLDGSVAKLNVMDGFKIAWFLVKSRIVGR